MIKKRIVVLTMVMSLLLNTTSNVALAESIYERDYKYDSVKELEKEIHNMYNNEVISKREKKILEENTAPEVKQEYARQQIEMIFNDEQKLLEDLSFNVSDTVTKTIDYGEGTKLTVTITDEEDLTPTEKFFDKINDLTSVTASAQSTSSQVTKSYGDRKCSGHFCVYIPVGKLDLFMTNHYTLSSSGIKERYGDSSASFIAYGSSASAGDCVITDAVAKTPNASDTNMYFKTYVSFSYGDVHMGYYEYMYSTLKLKAINYATKRVILEQCFSL